MSGELIESVLLLLRGWPPELVTFLIASLPVLEVRVAVPVAMEGFGLSMFSASFFGFLGSVVPAFLIPTFLHWFEAPCRKHIPWCARALDWSAEHVERRYTERYRALGMIGLVGFVAVPLPMTGVWTGSLAAWLFRMKKRHAIPAIMVGAAISTVIVTLATMGVFGVLRWL